MGKIIDLQTLEVNKEKIGKTSIIVAKTVVTALGSRPTNYIEGDTIYAELAIQTSAKPVIGLEYVFKAKESKAHSDFKVYMVDTDVVDVMDLII